MTFLKLCVLAFIGFSSGMIVAGGIFAFIAVIGIVPRFAQRTKTIKYIPIYEDFIILGGILGTILMYTNLKIPVGNIGASIIGFSIGTFVGCLAVSLAEVFNVMPIFTRRARLTKGIPAFMTAIALGKMLGSLVYFIIQGFYCGI